MDLWKINYEARKATWLWVCCARAEIGSDDSLRSPLRLLSLLGLVGALYHGRQPALRKNPGTVVAGEPAWREGLLVPHAAAQWRGCVSHAIPS